MTIRHLKIFIAVCEYGSTTKAAEALFLLQPTVSHAIADLEKYYKVNLFNRVNQRLLLTDAGKELLMKAKETVASFDDFEEFATSQGQNPKVKIGASLTLGQTLIPRFLQGIQEKGLPIEPRILIRQSTRIENELEQGNLDFGVISGNVLSPYLTAIPLSKELFTLVAHVDFPIPDKIAVQDLSKYPLLIREHGSSSRDLLESFANAHGINLSPIMDSSNNQALITALYAGLGVAFLPHSYLMGHLERNKFKEIEIEGFDANQTHYLIIHKNKKLNPLQQQAYDFIQTLEI